MEDGFINVLASAQAGQDEAIVSTTSGNKIGSNLVQKKLVVQNHTGANPN